MEKNTIFQKQFSKLKLEAVVKSSLVGVAVGLGVNFVTSLITWFTPMRGFWLSLLLFAIVAPVASILFYYKRFYPSDVQNARRLDSMGLEERLVTMVEFADVDSGMARIQREDARRVLSSIEKGQIKLKISKALIVIFASALFLAASMTTVNAMSESGHLPGGDELLGSLVDDATKVSYLINYEAEEGGSIYGKTEQLVQEGSASSAVVALSSEGYYFVMWSDGNTSPARIDENVTADATYVAIFKKLNDADAWTDTDEGDSAEDAPENKQQGQGPGESIGDNPQDSMHGGGKYQPNNQVINGNIYYREIIEEYKDTADERIFEENNTLTEEEIEFIKQYLGIV